jgi:hypothetical protein
VHQSEAIDLKTQAAEKEKNDVRSINNYWGSLRPLFDSSPNCVSCAQLAARLWAYLPTATEAVGDAEQQKTQIVVSSTSS